MTKGEPILGSSEREALEVCAALALHLLHLGAESAAAFPASGAIPRNGATGFAGLATGLILRSAGGKGESAKSHQGRESGLGQNGQKGIIPQRLDR